MPKAASDRRAKQEQLSRCKAALLGCAIGDALGITQETFVERPNHLEHTLEQIHQLRQARAVQGLQTEMKGGGPWEHITLEPGEWTDDTSMMLCLCDSISQRGPVHTADLIQKFGGWWYEGLNACRWHKSVGLGSNTQEALQRFDPDSPEKLTGGTNPATDAGNGALMRLYPVPVFWHQDVSMAMFMARKQAQTTHNVSEAMDTCAVMAFMIWHAINGADKQTMFDILPTVPHVKHEDVASLIRSDAKWRHVSEDDIISLPSRAVWTLEAALWCLLHTDNFEDAIIKAVNLCADADTVAAVTGQIAGALYGLKSIPLRWLQVLKHKASIEERATALYRQQPYQSCLLLTY